MAAQLESMALLTPTAVRQTVVIDRPVATATGAGIARRSRKRTPTLTVTPRARKAAKLGPDVASVQPIECDEPWAHIDATVHLPIY